MSDQPRTLIRPGELAFVRGFYDPIRADELKRELAKRRTDALEAAQRTLDKLDLELAGLAQIRARERAVDLARHGFDTTDLRPTPLPTERERAARRHRGRANIDPIERARKEETFASRCLVRTYTTSITVR